jgi:branched-chain amino acid transport system ATP-binding protein
MTVLDNVMAGRHLHGRAGMISAALRLPRHWRDERAARRDGHAQLAELGLAEYADTRVAGLPFGLQRRVALARALGVADRLLLLDEPAAGLTGGERTELSRSIASLRDAGRSILLIEHDVRFVAGIADTLLVLDRGAVLASGAPSEVLADPKVVAAYSGVSA